MSLPENRIITQRVLNQTGASVLTMNDSGRRKGRPRGAAYFDVQGRPIALADFVDMLWTTPEPACPSRVFRV
jgi:hypothetical protein